MVLDRGTHLGRPAVDDGTKRLGIDPFAKRGRADEIGKDDGNGLPGECVDRRPIRRFWRVLRHTARTQLSLAPDPDGRSSAQRV